MEAPAHPTSAAGPGWVWTFRVVLVLVVVSTLNALRMAFLAPEEFLSFFPGAVGWPFRLLAVAAVAGIVGKIGLWFWQCWAIWLTVATGAATMALDIVADAPLPHRVAVVVTTAVVLGLAWRLRARFRPAAQP